jgi:hypothetical protein
MNTEDQKLYASDVAKYMNAYASFSYDAPLVVGSEIKVLLSRRNNAHVIGTVESISDHAVRLVVILERKVLEDNRVRVKECL